METPINVQKKGWRSRQEREELVLQWQQSGKSRKEFCESTGIGYNSLVNWCKQIKDKNATTGFTEVKLNHEPSLFAQVHLPGGIKIDFYQAIPADFIRSFLKT